MKNSIGFRGLYFNHPLSAFLMAILLLLHATILSGCSKVETREAPFVLLDDVAHCVDTIAYDDIEFEKILEDMGQRTGFSLRYSDFFQIRPVETKNIKYSVEFKNAHLFNALDSLMNLTGLGVHENNRSFSFSPYYAIPEISIPTDYFWMKVYLSPEVGGVVLGDDFTKFRCVIDYDPYSTSEIQVEKVFVDGKQAKIDIGEGIGIFGTVDFVGLCHCRMSSNSDVCVELSFFKSKAIYRVTIPDGSPGKYQVDKTDIIVGGVENNTSHPGVGGYTIPFSLKNAVADSEGLINVLTAHYTTHEGEKIGNAYSAVHGSKGQILGRCETGGSSLPPGDLIIDFSLVEREKATIGNCGGSQ